MPNRPARRPAPRCPTSWVPGLCPAGPGRRDRAKAACSDCNQPVSKRWPRDGGPIITRLREGALMEESIHPSPGAGYLAGGDQVTQLGTEIAREVDAQCRECVEGVVGQWCAAPLPQHRAQFVFGREAHPMVDAVDEAAGS